MAEEKTKFSPTLVHLALTSSKADEVIILRAVELPRTLREIVGLTAIPERRCKSLLQDYQRRGFVRLLPGRRWRITPDGKKYRSELEGHAVVQKAKGRPSRTLHRQYKDYLKSEALHLEVVSRRNRLLRLLKRSEEALDRCRKLPDFRDLQPELRPWPERLRFFLARLKSEKDQAALKEFDRVAEPVLRRAKAVLSRFETLTKFQIMQSDRNVTAKCPRCGHEESVMFSSPGDEITCSRCGWTGEYPEPP